MPTAYPPRTCSVLAVYSVPVASCLLETLSNHGFPFSLADFATNQSLDSVRQKVSRRMGAVRIRRARGVGTTASHRSHSSLHQRTAQKIPSVHNSVQRGLSTKIQRAANGLHVHGQTRSCTMLAA